MLNVEGVIFLVCIFLVAVAVLSLAVFAAARAGLLRGREGKARDSAPPGQ